MGVPNAICPNCGSHHHGWALLNPRHQTCPNCGRGLKVSANGQMFEGYLPFEAKKLTPEKQPYIPPAVNQEGE